MCNSWCPVKCCSMYYVLNVCGNITGKQAEFKLAGGNMKQICTQYNALISIFFQTQDCIPWCQMCFVEARDGHTELMWRPTAVVVGITKIQ